LHKYWGAVEDVALKPNTYGIVSKYIPGFTGKNKHTRKSYI